MTMKVLITGANGQLGRELKRTRPDGWLITALSRSDLNVVDSAAVESTFFEYQPELVINTAAYTAVDKAESEKDQAYAVNANGAAILARAAESIRARFIHISTDFVFDGSSSQPDLPEDNPAPLGVYGASKRLG